MKKELSSEQINELFRFTEKKYVKYYDIQLELVDHLASSIEAEMQTEEGLSFEMALQKVYKRFGIFGFDELQQERLRSAEKTKFRLQLQAASACFKWPFISVFALLLITLTFCFNQFSTSSMIICLTLVLICAEIAVQLRDVMYRKKYLHRQLALYTSNMHFYAGFLPWVFYQLFRYITFDHAWQYAVIYTLLISFQAGFVIALRKTRETARKLYPEAFAS